MGKGCVQNPRVHSSPTAMQTTCLLAFVPLVAGHGHITYPASTRHGGSLAEAGRCDHAECLYFSQPVSIPGEPTINEPRLRTYNVDVSEGKGDWSRTTPWRAPGTAPVFGSGCGLAGGNKVPLPNGGNAAGAGPGQRQGDDGVLLPRREPVEWSPGSVQEVAFGITANHGGGYLWRLCKLDRSGGVSEDCFQKTVLKFASESQWIQYGNQTYQYDKMVQLPRFELPLVKTSKGTYPPGSEWARVQVPGCRLCDQSVCGAPLMPNLTDKFKPGPPLYPPDVEFYGGLAWFRQQQCAQSCSGLNLTACPPGLTQFPEVLPGVSGYTGPVRHSGLPFSIVDKVEVPKNLEAGEYLLSWRWDCEQSHQIWQNCADVRILESRVV